MDVFCGIDWAEDHHDIALVDRDGKLLARRRISDDAAGLAALLDLLAEHGDSPGDPIPVAIETPRGLLVACLRATGRPVYPINPMAVARYRDRHSVAGQKSDHGDSVVLANVLRTDMHAHRPLPADSELAQAIAVLARAQQDAVWDRTTAHNKLRSHLREYYPGFLAAFADARGGIMRPEARAVLAAAPDPGRRRHAHPDPAARPAEEGRPQPRHRHRGRPAARGVPRPADAPAPARRAGHGPPGPGPARPARRRLRRRRATSSRPPPSLLTSTRTPGSSPASQGSAHSPAPGCSPRSATTGPGSPMPKASRPTPAPPPSPAPAARPRSVTAPPRQEQPADRRRLHLGVLRPDRLTRRPRPLRPPQRRRRPARRRPAQPVRPPPRLPAPLPGHRPALRRSHRLPHRHRETSPGSLTT